MFAVLARGGGRRSANRQSFPTHTSSNVSQGDSPRRKVRHTVTNDLLIFETALSSYNSSTTSLFESVGRADVKLRLCHQCCDIKKEISMDMYYVNKMDASPGTVLCHECMIKRMIGTS